MRALIHRGVRERPAVFEVGDLRVDPEVAAAHDGTIIATDAPGGGARFEVRLPARGSGRARKRPER